ncbi:MAG: alkaline phosphatase family protein [Acidimicrobiales bacterium]
MSNQGESSGPDQITGPVTPAFGQGCTTDLLAPLLGVGDGAALPATFPTSGPRVLLVLDGLGWLQLQERSHLAPTLSAMAGGPITTVAPSTTATALTSITTALTPAEHGIVGYRMVVDGQVLNTLRWATPSNPDARSVIPPAVLQPYAPFMGRSPALVTKAEFRLSGFSEAHLRGGRLIGYRTPAVLVHETARLLRGGEEVVYAYYEGIDKVAHEYGLDSTYEAELSFVDRLVAAVLEAVPSGTTVLVTADHGQVDCRHGSIPIDPDVLANCTGLSGEGRFRWLHAGPDRLGDVVAAAEEAHGDRAWIRTADQMLDERWFGTGMSPGVRERLGDVALLPFEAISFDDPDDTGPFDLVGRHGSLTSAEMLVPCLVASA